jgi:hypothetical protein
MPRLDYGPPPYFFFRDAGAPPVKFGGVLLRGEAGLLRGGRGSLVAPFPKAAWTSGAWWRGRF